MKTLSILLALAAATAAYGKPPQAPPLRAAKPAQAPACASCCGKPDCDCGCKETGVCDCAKKKAVPELSKSYAARWQAEGWTWDEAGGYWFKYPEPPAPQAVVPLYQPAFRPSFQPAMPFGGFGGGGGGC